MRWRGEACEFRDMRVLLDQPLHPIGAEACDQPVDQMRDLGRRIAVGPSRLRRIEVYLLRLTPNAAHGPPALNDGMTFRIKAVWVTGPLRWAHQ